MKHRRVFSQFLQKPTRPSCINEISSELAKNIIEKELELEHNITSTAIHELIALYSKAMEHYEQQENSKYLDYQERMHKMLIRPQVLLILKQKNCKNGNPETSSIIKSEEIKPNSLESPIQASDELSQRKYQAELTRKELSAQLNTSLFKHKSEKNFNIIIDRHSNFTKETAHRAVVDFKSQDLAVDKRLASRQRKKLNHSLSFGNFDSNDLKMFSCDVSDIYEENNTSTKSSLFVIEEQIKDNFEQFEKGLEEIMEKNFGERSLKIAEIKQKYESQINEFAGMGEVMEMVVEQMKKNMKEDIDNITEEYVAKRKEDIQKLKDGIDS